ncbi:molybdopterin oxidoreductase [Cellulomonas endophytica]|uniref:molybdopterin oxidoreductase n=1 Tax=Cellulomonas endophytica TaxID=2494735 RepID=UPI0010133910|nr:molybdopterin oxidoreductase [Cellulomonas endophytica]
MPTTPRFLQSVAEVVGAGLHAPVALTPALVHTVPDGAVAQPVYFRGGNAADELVNVVLLRDGAVMRYFPIGAKDGCHVPLRVVENLEAGTRLELRVAAPAGARAVVVLDLGLVEV